MDAYSNVKVKKLKLKGEVKKKHKKKKKVKEVVMSKSVFTADKEAHGDWWRVLDIDSLNGNIAIQFLSHSSLSDNAVVSGSKRKHDSSSEDEDDIKKAVPVTYACYLSCMDDGSLTVGSFRNHGCGPDPEEVLVCMKLSDSKVSFKTGYGKYVGITEDEEPRLVAIADAIGVREQFEPIFQDNKSALLGANGCFVSAKASNGEIMCCSTVAKSEEMLTFRNNKCLDIDVDKFTPDEEREGVSMAELNYIRKYQSWQDSLVVSKEDKKKLKKAKHRGEFHECMLDRREKTKSDRYCK